MLLTKEQEEILRAGILAGASRYQHKTMDALDVLSANADNQFKGNPNMHAGYLKALRDIAINLPNSAQIFLDVTDEMDEKKKPFPNLN